MSRLFSGSEVKIEMRLLSILNASAKARSEAGSGTSASTPQTTTLRQTWKRNAWRWNVSKAPEDFALWFGEKYGLKTLSEFEATWGRA
jgi:hypothetical protein